MDSTTLRKIVEGALLASGQPLSVTKLQELFEEEQRPEKDEIIAALQDLESDCRDRSFELKQVASGYRLQVRQEFAPWIARLWEEKPKKYSRALLETLVLIAYRQPTTRGDIEQVRGVAVSSDIIRTLMEREWVRVVGHRDVPGRPALYATTKQFLDYFNLASLEELPPLGEIRDLDELNVELDLGGDDSAAEHETGEDSAGGDRESSDDDDSNIDQVAAAGDSEGQRPTAEIVRLPVNDRSND